MTLIIENANDAILRVVESLKGLNSDLKITTENADENECEICRAHDYTPKMSDEMREALKESEEMSKNPHLYPSYTSIEALVEALETDD